MFKKRTQKGQAKRAAPAAEVSGAGPRRGWRTRGEAAGLGAAFSAGAAGGAAGQPG